MMPKLSPEILLAAIEGFETQKTRIDAQIAELRQMLEGGSAGTTATSKVVPGKRKVSAAARRRMALGQKKRWAATKNETELTPQAAPEPARSKRKLSAAGRAAIVAALKKRWAAKKAEAVKAEAVKAKPPVGRKAAVKKVA